MKKNNTNFHIFYFRKSVQIVIESCKEKVTTTTDKINDNQFSSKNGQK